MRYSVVFLGISGALMASAPAVAAPRKQPVRKVELISMNDAQLGSAARALAEGEAVLDAPAPPLPEAFQVHDLSRRYVQFRMQQELSQAAEQQAVAIGSTAAAYGGAGVAPMSSIAVPGWLRSNYQSVPVAFAPGCSPLTYRPSGFLARTAEARRAAFYGMMSAVACEHGIPTGLFDAMIIRESGYNPIATSTANAFGLAQLMPGTAAGLGVNRYDPLQNMHGGARYLRQQLDRFGQVQLALAAYNAGPGRVRAGLVPRITETQAYVTNIIANWSRLTAPPGSGVFQSTLPSLGRRNVHYTQF